MSTRTYRVAVTTVSPAARTHSITVDAPPNMRVRTLSVKATTPLTPQPNVGPDLINLQPWHQIPLVGTETSPVGPSVAKQWEQVSGRPVQILNAGTANAYYWAPGSGAGEQFEFGYRLQGSDGTWSPLNIVKHTFVPTAEYAAVGGRLVPMGIIAITTGASLGNLTQ